LARRCSGGGVEMSLQLLISDLREEIGDIIQRQEASTDPSVKADYSCLLSEKGEELEDLEQELSELSRQYV